MGRFDGYTTEQLYKERNKYQAKIDGPENDGRLTANGSMDLDHWFDMVDDLTAEIEKRASL